MPVTATAQYSKCVLILSYLSMTSNSNRKVGIPNCEKIVSLASPLLQFIHLVKWLSIIFCPVTGGGLWDRLSVISILTYSVKKWSIFETDRSMDV